MDEKYNIVMTHVFMKPNNLPCDCTTMTVVFLVYYAIHTSTDSVSVTDVCILCTGMNHHTYEHH